MEIHCSCNHVPIHTLQRIQRQIDELVAILGRQGERTTTNSTPPKRPIEVIDLADDSYISSNSSNSGSLNWLYSGSSSSSTSCQKEATSLY